MTRLPFIDVVAAQADVAEELAAAVARVAASGWYLLGPELEAFEWDFADYCEAGHCVGVGSGMSAIELALRALGIGPGDEVLVPAYTWIATWLAVSQVGARPVAVEADPATYNLDPEAAAAAVTERTAAIVPVHLRGEPADMDAVEELARAHGLAVIEDAAQAHGARHRGRRVGGLGNVAAFSFYPIKNLGAFGDGGAVTTDDPALAEKIRLLRNYGMKSRYDVEVAGVNSRLAELQAAVLRVKLGRLDAWNARRRELAGRYLDGLRGLEPVTMPDVPEWAEPVWHLFAIGHDERDACRERLGQAGIETLVHYPVLPHMSPPYAEAGAGPLPVAERLAARALSLPLHPGLDGEAVDRVVDALRDACHA
ncbi:MAG TPA: DegT/DnrJ/EryC1/StrS family aminotransferase [Solirubrobacterales bacterium]|nr:DegT/DnrJ/EryC1/StrS family aminotransferase [Solirubrobacterales bacterium]